MYLRKATLPGRTPQAAYHSMVVTWLSLVMSLFIYVFVARVVVGRPGFSGSGEVGLLFPVFVGVSFAVLGIQAFLRRNLGGDENLFPRILKGRSGVHNEVPGPEDALRKELIQQHYTLNVVLWALGESIAIYGLVLTLISGDIRYVIGFGAFSLLNMIFFRPRRHEIEEQFLRLQRYVQTRMPGPGSRSASAPP